MLEIDLSRLAIILAFPAFDPEGTDREQATEQWPATVVGLSSPADCLE
jgi:hypothetical protein